MTRSKQIRRMVRPFSDFLAGLVLFGAVVWPLGLQPAESGSGWLATSAHARLFEIEMLERATDLAWTAPMPLVQPAASAIVSMALAFAALFAVNLWFARHVRRAHASYSRSRR